ncbi:MAG: hypothetical protein JW819_13070 [Candidatus Krumholzibacteriota bacterium]|nr:hypothetical protein [Candidatus Krumholzibacteriota bacterium]
MRFRMPGGLTSIGGVLLALSGVVSLVVALTLGAVYYDPDPNGLFGHVGIVAGLIAFVIGVFLFWFGRLDHAMTPRLFLAGAVSIVVGHLGAVAGALLVGTAGLLCCYVAGVWCLVLGVMSWRRKIPRSQKPG